MITSKLNQTWIKELYHYLKHLLYYYLTKMSKMIFCLKTCGICDKTSNIYSQFI